MSSARPIKKSSKLKRPLCSLCVVEFSRNGHFVRKSDQEIIQRWICDSCGKTTSASRCSIDYRQKIRGLHLPIAVEMSTGCSQRDCAFKLRVDRKTVVRRFVSLGSWAVEALRAQVFDIKKVDEIQFDDMEGFIHTKFKPVSITLAVSKTPNQILGLRVSSMPAKGILAKQALLKYGPRADERKKNRRDLLYSLKHILTKGAVVKSDQNPHYLPDVKEILIGHPHERFKGRRGCVIGQGEIKKGRFDPLFALNHTCAMFRAKVCRLVRRTWCTSKRIDRLEYHLAIYSMIHNWRKSNRKLRLQADTKSDLHYLMELLIAAAASV